MLDALERYSKEKLAREGVKDAEYRIDKPNRVNFFRLVKERGLDLRFGAATFITTAFFMAPITALFLVFFYGVLRRGLHACDGLTFVLGFGTPLFFRTSVLNHNMFVMYAMFIAFALLWLPPAGRRCPCAGAARRVLRRADASPPITSASSSCRCCYGYFVLPRAESVVVGGDPRVASDRRRHAPAGPFLLYSQWAMYGNPFFPGQHWMPDQNIYVHEGMRGFTLPSLDLSADLFDPAYGMYTWAPVLAAGARAGARHRAVSSCCRGASAAGCG